MRASDKARTLEDTTEDRLIGKVLSKNGEKAKEQGCRETWELQEGELVAKKWKVRWKLTHEQPPQAHFSKSGFYFSQLASVPQPRNARGAENSCKTPPPHKDWAGVEVDCKAAFTRTATVCVVKTTSIAGHILNLLIWKGVTWATGRWGQRHLLILTMWPPEAMCCTICNQNVITARVIITQLWRPHRLSRTLELGPFISVSSLHQHRFSEQQAAAFSDKQLHIAKAPNGRQSRQISRQICSPQDTAETINKLKK